MHMENEEQERLKAAEAKEWQAQKWYYFYIEGIANNVGPTREPCGELNFFKKTYLALLFCIVQSLYWTVSADIRTIYL